MKEVTKKQSVFMQMHNGERTGEGSFNVGLKELFYKADAKNRRKLVDAFHEFFGDEVPEFGITGKKVDNKNFMYKKWLCEWHEEEGVYFLYTPEELDQQAAFPLWEWERETKEQCKQFIDSY